jgi:hypothetical protein
MFELGRYIKASKTIAIKNVTIKNAVPQLALPKDCSHCNAKNDSERRAKHYKFYRMRFFHLKPIVPSQKQDVSK